MKISALFLAEIIFAFGAACLIDSSASAKSVPAEADYFRTNAAGFIVERKDAKSPEIVRYGMGFVITRDIVKPLYVRTRFENPADPAHPLTIDSMIHPGAKSFGIDSPPVAGLKAGGKYKVEILVFDSASRTREISRHVAYVLFF